MSKKKESLNEKSDYYLNLVLPLPPLLPAMQFFTRALYSQQIALNLTPRTLAHTSCDSKLLFSFAGVYSFVIYWAQLSHSIQR